MRRYAVALAASLILPAGQAASAQDRPGDRTVTITVYGDDPCPDARSGGDIVVCARRPETERYRIPKELRGRNQPLSETSWGSQVAAMEDANRATMPGSCSPVGTYGQTGCRQQLLRDWYDQRRAARNAKE